LDSTKAKRCLGWRPQLLLDQAVDLTVDWYKADTSESYDMGEFSEQQIREYSSMSTTESRE
jgi:CDP-glucose 4,6-dehydratase